MGGVDATVRGSGGNAAGGERAARPSPVDDDRAGSGGRPVHRLQTRRRAGGSAAGTDDVAGRRGGDERVRTVRCSPRVARRAGRDHGVRAGAVRGRTGAGRRGPVAGWFAGVVGAGAVRIHHLPAASGRSAAGAGTGPRVPNTGLRPALAGLRPRSRRTVAAGSDIRREPGPVAPTSSRPQDAPRVGDRPRGRGLAHPGRGAGPPRSGMMNDRCRQGLSPLRGRVLPGKRSAQ